MLKKTTQNKKRSIDRVFMRLNCLAITVFALTTLFVQPSYGLGLGDVQLESYIGQNFVASIPLLSVSDSNSLLVDVTPVNDVVLQSQVLKIDDQLMIRILSEQSISEPYLQFSLKISGQSQTLVREFTVLLEINPQAGLSNQTINSSTPLSSQQLSSERIVEFSTTSGGTLGPYEWAQKGQIPSRFGAVLDGQSLWRVARRINSAMGVSINQMMWALYSYNPDAFSNDSIESLRAGVYLDIPQLSLVANVSDVQAKRNLDNLSSVNQTVSVPVETPVSSVVTKVDEEASPVLSEQIEETVVLDEPTSNLVVESTEPAEAEFKLLGLDDTSMLNSDNPTETNEQAIETINVLSVTVGNLTQELIRKDKQIEFLEEKIAALEDVAALDSASLESLSMSSESPPIVTPSVVAPSIESRTMTPNQLEIKPWYLWLSLFLIALLGLFLFRNKLRALNIFGGVDVIEFVKQENLNIPTASTVNVKEGRDFREISATNKSVQEYDEGNSEHSYDSFAEISINYIDDDSVNEEEDPDKDIGQGYSDFEQSFESLIKNEDYNKAVELLESSRNKTIDDDRYYFERLRCYFLNNDEDGFYAFYDEIEYTIQRFPENWNRQISEMVIELGHNVKMDSA